MFAYILVLQAYRIASVSYAGAIREISVVFGALAGWRWLGEGFGLPRTIGALLIFLGILVIAAVGETNDGRHHRAMRGANAPHRPTDDRHRIAMSRGGACRGVWAD